jgi:hypothetical protein
MQFSFQRPVEKIFLLSFPRGSNCTTSHQNSPQTLTNRCPPRPAVQHDPNPHSLSVAAAMPAPASNRKRTLLYEKKPPQSYRLTAPSFASNQAPCTLHPASPPPKPRQTHSRAPTNPASNRLKCLPACTQISLSYWMKPKYSSA